MITEQQKAQKAINLANLLEQKYGNIPEVQELVGKVRAKFAVSEQKPKPRSYGIGGEYGKPPGFREKLSQQMQMGVIPPPGYDVDPATGEYIKRNEWRWYDPLRGIGKVAEGIGGFIPSMAVYPEGIPEMIKGTAAGVGESWKRLAGASPLSPHYDPMASLELAQDPVGNLVMSTLPVALAFGGVKGARKLAGKPKVMPKEAVKPTKIKEATEPKVTEAPREFKEMPKAKPTGKQPWEMTREEARNKEIDLRQICL